jgi:predicted DNA-binding protein YlxM (UPF0122 family)
MDKRVELNWLLDFYGPLLTKRRQTLLKLYLEEDLSLQEIAEQASISRQGVYDAIANAQRQLEAFERKLSLLARYRRIQSEIDACKEALKLVRSTEDTEPRLRAALLRLNRIERIEG